MKISNTNNKNQSFGLLYTHLLSDKHRQFVRPVLPKLAKIGKKCDLFLQTGMEEIERGSDYSIMSECIKISASKNGMIDPNNIKKIFTNQYIGTSTSQQNSARSAILDMAFDVAKNALRKFSVNT